MALSVPESTASSRTTVISTTRRSEGMRWGSLHAVFLRPVPAWLISTETLNKKEVAPDGRKDENVFDIKQGVAIGPCWYEIRLPQRSAGLCVLRAPVICWGETGAPSSTTGSTCQYGTADHLHGYRIAATTPRVPSVRALRRAGRPNTSTTHELAINLQRGDGRSNGTGDRHDSAMQFVIDVRLERSRSRTQSRRPSLDRCLNREAARKLFRRSILCSRLARDWKLTCRPGKKDVREDGQWRGAEYHAHPLPTRSTVRFMYYVRYVAGARLAPA